MPRLLQKSETIRTSTTTIWPRSMRTCSLRESLRIPRATPHHQAPPPKAALLAPVTTKRHRLELRVKVRVRTRAKAKMTTTWLKSTLKSKESRPILPSLSPNLRCGLRVAAIQATALLPPLIQTRAPAQIPPTMMLRWALRVRICPTTITTSRKSTPRSRLRPRLPRRRQMLWSNSPASCLKWTPRTIWSTWKQC